MWPFTKAATDQPSHAGGWRRIVGEPYTGAWQRNDSLTLADTNTYHTLYAVLDRISSDIGKLPFQVMMRGSDGVQRVVSGGEATRILSRPNDYQTASQLRASWILSKLQHGNTVALKNQGELYVLDWERVEVLVSEGGSVFYKIATADRSVAPTGITVPASDVMHDRGPCLHNQLIGVPPLAAAHLSAAKNQKLLENARDLADNGNQQGGLLTVPNGISDEDAKALRDYWSKTTAKDVRVVATEAKFDAWGMTSEQSQMTEQLELSDKAICQPFGVPPFVIGAAELPSGQRPNDYMQTYFKLALQHLVESMESLLTKGLGLANGQRVRLDTSELLRMDQTSRGQFYIDMTKAGLFTRNEARAAFDLPPVPGGDQITVQQQDVPLSSVGARHD